MHSRERERERVLIPEYLISRFITVVDLFQEDSSILGLSHDFCFFLLEEYSIFAVTLNECGA